MRERIFGTLAVLLLVFNLAGCKAMTGETLGQNITTPTSRPP